MRGISRDRLFVALSRPQMIAGVTYTFFVLNMIVATELFLILKSVWAVAAALLLHLVGVLACMREPRIFDLWMVRSTKCPRIRNHRIWRCNSYRP